MAMKKVLFLLLSFVLMSSYSSSASVVVESREQHHPKNYSIMYMKDGEPVDKHADQKLLYSLWKELFILDIQFKFVGPDIVDTRIGKMNYAQLSEDSKSCNKAERLEKLVAEYQPDIVLLDIVKCDDTLKSDYSKSWASVITDMLQANSNVKIILSKTGLGSEYVSHIAGLPMTSGMPSMIGYYGLTLILRLKAFIRSSFLIIKVTKLVWLGKRQKFGQTVLLG